MRGADGEANGKSLLKPSLVVGRHLAARVGERLLAVIPEEQPCFPQQ